MNAELNSFLWKFTQLCGNGYKAELVFKSKVNRIQVDLQVDLEVPAFQAHHMPTFYQNQPPFVKRFSKPSRVKRRQKRAFSRQFQQDNNAKSRISINETSVNTASDVTVTGTDQDTNHYMDTSPLMDTPLDDSSQPTKSVKHILFDTANPSQHLDLDSSCQGISFGSQPIDDLICDDQALHKSPLPEASQPTVVMNKNGSSDDKQNSSRAGLDALTYGEFVKIMENFKLDFKRTPP